MSLEAVLDRLFGVRTRAEENPLISSVGTTALRVLPNDPDRLAWLIVNLSGNVMYASIGTDPSATKGIRLDPNGGSATMLFSEDFQAVGWEVWIVATGATSSLYSLAIKGL